jgi:hypothetical protein
MKKIFAVMISLAFVAFAGSVSAAEVKGFIKSINNRTIVVQTNAAGQVNAPAGIDAQTVTLTVPAPATGTTDMLVGISPGMTVTVTYATTGTGATAVNTVSKIVR